MSLYVIETIQTFRHRYVINADQLEHAFDTVAMNEASEFSQMYLGEQIVSGREITMKKFHKMTAALEKDGDGTHYQPETGSHWMGESLIHKVKY